MSTPEITGALSDGANYRVTAYALQIFSPTGQIQEELDLQDLSDVARDGHAVSLRFRDGRTRIFTGATYDDAGRLQESLRRHVRAAPAVRAAQPPPTTTQSVQVSGSGTSAASIIIGLVVIALIVVLIIFVVSAITDDDSEDATATPESTEEPAAPTEEPAAPTEEAPPTEPAAEDEPTESARLLYPDGAGSQSEITVSYPERVLSISGGVPGAGLA